MIWKQCLQIDTVSEWYDVRYDNVWYQRSALIEVIMFQRSLWVCAQYSQYTHTLHIEYLHGVILLCLLCVPKPIQYIYMCVCVCSTCCDGEITVFVDTQRNLEYFIRNHIDKGHFSVPPGLRSSLALVSGKFGVVSGIHGSVSVGNSLWQVGNP